MIFANLYTILEYYALRIVLFNLPLVLFKNGRICLSHLRIVELIRLS
jgi:hypothetical protein